MIADSSAWIELLRGRATPVAQRLERALKRGERLFMPDVVYQEVLQGARDPHHFVRLQAQLDLVPPFIAQDARQVAHLAAMLYARSRWQGSTLRSPNDCLIAACAIEADEPLLHADRDFDRIAEIDPRLRFA
ncbi:MAG TPA: PIN domain-containing protein [Ramlibacter sp.]|nr:PIN domain-containing protein [Ramlibacter sp.]